MEFTNQEIYGNCIGIYCIKQLSTNKRYIGQTRERFNRRLWHHDCVLKNNNHRNKKLQEAWNISGEDDFIFEVIEVLTEPETLDDKEIYYISFYNSVDNGFNISFGGKGTLGVSLSDETKAKIGKKNRINMLGRKFSAETREKMRKSSRHIGPSEAGRKRISEYMRTRVVSEHTKEIAREQNLGSKSNFAILNEEQVKEIKTMLKSGNYIVKEIAKQYNVSISSIYAIKNGKTWSYV